jgi:hypothetical protein
VSTKASVEIGGQEYLIVLEKGEASVSGGTDSLAGSIQKLVETALEEYTPAVGGRASYIAAWVAEKTNGKVLSVDEPLSEKGVVY